MKLKLKYIVEISQDGPEDMFDVVVTDAAIPGSQCKTYFLSMKDALEGIMRLIGTWNLWGKQIEISQQEVEALAENRMTDDQ